MEAKINLMQGDCLERMKEIPSESVDMVLTDPPYNIGCTTTINGKKILNKWDEIENYIDWSISWLLECQRVLKPTGVLYFFHNDMKQIAELLCEIKKKTDFMFVSFCIWDKGNGYRAGSWMHRKPDSKSSIRFWFNVCEYCLHFFKTSQNKKNDWKKTGSDYIKSNPECYKPLKDWYSSEKERLGITDQDISIKYTEVTGRKPYMLRHYFKDSQFEIPTKKIFESVYVPLGFVFTSKNGRGYEGLKQEYEPLRKEYEAMRNTHICDDMHCNIWHIPPVPTQKRYHTCQKPVELLERLCKVSTKDGGIVLDPFMGSGSTGVACVNTERNFIGIELDEKYFKSAKQRIEEASRIKADI